MLRLTLATPHRHPEHNSILSCTYDEKEKLGSRRQTLRKQFYRHVEPHCGKPAAYVNLPEAIVKPHQVKAMNQLFSLPLETPMLTTRIAQLPKALVRTVDCLPPRDLCSTHTWFDPDVLTYITKLVAKEIHHQTGNFWLYRGILNVHTLQVLEDLHAVEAIFRLDTTRGVKFIRSAADAFPSVNANDADTNCLACDLGMLMRDKKAVKALATLCKARKKHRRHWPELLAYLEPIETGEDDKWKVRWLKESSEVRKDRRMIRSRIEAGLIVDANASLAIKEDRDAPSPSSDGTLVERREFPQEYQVQKPEKDVKSAYMDDYDPFDIARVSSDNSLAEEAGSARHHSPTTGSWDEGSSRSMKGRRDTMTTVSRPSSRRCR